MESGGQYENGRYKPDFYKGTQSMWNMMPQHQIKEQHNALVMNKKIMSILAERDAAIKEKNEAVTAKKEALAERDEALEERDKALEERDNAIMERDSALNALQFRESNLNYILSCAKKQSQQNLPNPSPLSIIPPKKPSSSKRKKKDLNREVASPGKKCKKEWGDSNDIFGLVTFDETTMQAPVCTCTGTARQCYKWGNGGWQSSCCTTTLSQYPLPQLPNKRHSRIGGRKMSGGVFSRLLSRLASEGHELSSSPVDLKDYWARHGTNRYITINERKTMEKPKTSPSPQLPPRKRWFNRVKTFLDEVPNPRIVTIFLISSFATFFSGIAYLFEWTFHGKNHTGFQWIIFYALFLIFLPVLIWLGLGYFMVVSSSHESNQVAVSSVVEEETKDDNNCRSLAVLVESDSENISDENKILKLKRSVSYPLQSHQVRSCRTR